jgi:RHS repeat-associated protein
VQSDSAPEGHEDISQRPQGRVAVGHPVDVASGTFFCAWNDVEVGGYAPLVLRRYYSTGLRMQSLAGLGPGWTHNFAMSLARTPEGYLFRDQNGGVIEFEQSTADPPERILRNAAASMELRLEAEAARIYHWHDWKTAVEVLRFARIGQLFRLEAIAPPSGFGLALQYDESGRLASVAQVIEGRRLQFHYDEPGRLVEVRLHTQRNAGRVVAAYQYDESGRLGAVMDALSAPIRYGYDPEGRIIEEATRSGAVFAMRYDREGRCVSTRGRDGHHACKLQYALDGRLTLVTNSLGAVTAYELNGSGQVVRERRSDGASFSIRYDESGRIVEEEDPFGAVTRYEYDEASNTRKVVYPSGLEMHATYDEDHQPLMVRQGDRTWQFRYARGLLTAVTDPRGAQRQYRYDRRGYLNTIVEPSGNTLKVEADADFTHVMIRDGLGIDRQQHYNDLMHVTQIVEPDGGIYRFEFDALGRLVSAAAPGSQPRAYAYDSTGYLSSATDPAGFSTKLRHNVYGKIEHIRTPTGRVFTCKWDTEGRLRAWTNPAGETAEFEHDAYGNETRVVHFDGRVETAVFDALGRRKRWQRGDGKQLEFEYDIASNLLRVHSGGADLVVNEFDALGQLLATRTPGCVVSFEYGPAGERLAEIQNGRRVECSYDATGAIATRTMAGSALPPLVFEWDARNRLTAVHRGGHPVQTLSYDLMDHCVERRFGASVERFTYEWGKVVKQEVAVRDQVAIERSLVFDARQNIVRIHDLRRGIQRFEFDADHRLTMAATPSDESEYDYDANGNLVSRTGSRGSWKRVDVDNELRRSDGRRYERDDNGRVILIESAGRTWKLSWDALGQLTEIQPDDAPATRFFYDGLGRRLRRVRGDEATEFVWFDEQLVAEMSAGKATEYLFNGFNPAAQWRNGAIAYYVSSHLSVPLEMLDEFGTVARLPRLDAWGNVEADGALNDATTPWRFAGQYADPDLGLHYNRYRYYDPQLGQYLSPDPYGLAAGANEFVYTANPVNWIDPWGLACGIPPGQHSVYVLESGTRGPPPTPPTPPIVIYVGITMQSPHDRLSQHRGNPPGGVSPDGMRIIATGPPAVPDRTSARIIEASILNNSPAHGTPGGLNNAPRPTNPGYYHSNITSSAPPGTTLMPPASTAPLLAPTNGTVIT